MEKEQDKENKNEFEESILIEKRKDVINSLCVKFPQLTRQLEYMRDLILEQSRIVELLSLDVKDESLLKKKMKLLASNVIGMKDVLVTQDKILYGWAQELKAAQAQNLNWPDTFKQSDEYVEFQKEYSLIQSSINDVMKLCMEQEQLVTKLQERKIDSSTTVNLINTIVNQENLIKESSANEPEIPCTEQDFIELQEKYNTVKKNFDWYVKENNKLQNNSAKTINDLQNKVKELTTKCEEQNDIISNLENSKENVKELQLVVEEKDLQIMKYNKYIKELLNARPKKVLNLKKDTTYFCSF